MVFPLTIVLVIPVRCEGPITLITLTLGMVITFTIISVIGVIGVIGGYGISPITVDVLARVGLHDVAGLCHLVEQLSDVDALHAGYDFNVFCG